MNRMNRRDFISGGASVALCMNTRSLWADSEACRLEGRRLDSWRAGRYQAHFIYTGAGESVFHIFPDGTTLLVDCGDFDSLARGNLAVPVLPDASRKAGEWIARYVMRVNPNGANVDYMLTTHFHRDHTGTLADGWAPSGWTLAARQLHFRKAFDRGYPDYRDPVPPEENANRIPELMRKLYADLAVRDGLTVERFRLGAVDQIVPMRKPEGVGDFSVRNICVNGRLAMPDGTIVDPLVRNGKFASYWDGNHMSCGFVVRYGRFRLFSAGDYSGRARLADGTEIWPEKLIGLAAGRVNVAKINHHGHHSMPEECLADLRARVYIACVWDQLHVTDDTLTRLSDRRVYSDERTIIPGILTAERRAAESGRPWMRDIPPETYTGVHAVVDVPPGGETYSVSLVDARDESMTVRKVMEFDS